MSRKNARKYALQSLYCWEINGCAEDEEPRHLEMTGKGRFLTGNWVRTTSPLRKRLLKM